MLKKKKKYYFEVKFSNQYYETYYIDFSINVTLNSIHGNCRVFKLQNK